MALAAHALTTVAAVEAVVGTAFGTARLEQLVNAVSQDMATFCGRSFGRFQVTTQAPEYYAGTGRTLLALDRYPILSVERVRVDGVEVTDVSRAPHLDRQGLLYRASGWPRRAPLHGDLTPDPDVTRPGYNVEVAYTAGWVLPKDTGRTLPYDLEQICIDEVVARLLRPAPGLTSERTPGGHAQTWAEPQGKLSAEAQAALVSYRGRHVG